MADADPAGTRRVLIISRAYYPHCSPGSHRIAGIAKHLPEFGWTPVIVCPDWTPQNCFERCDASLQCRDTCEVVRVPYAVHAGYTPAALWHRLLNRMHHWSLPHLAPLRLLRDLEARAERLLSERTFDAIVASHPPTMALTAAARVSEKSGVPWVADLRDLVVGRRPTPPLCPLKRLHVRRHAAVRRSARALVTVSPPLAERLAQQHPGTPVDVVCNGFDPDNYADGVEPDGDRFTMAYCGEIMSTESPALLFDALDHILRSGAEKLQRFRLRFYGTTPAKVERHLKGRRCAQLVHVMGRVPFDESIRAQQEANALLVLSCPGTKGILTSKVFEYLGARRPILAVPSDGGVIDLLLEETRAGKIGRTAEEIADILLDWVAEWKENGGPAWHGRAGAVEQYTRRSQAARMAQVLDRAVGANARAKSTSGAASRAQ
ncbi:MAG: glycosyltransferase [Planctomycetota bacterium]